MAKTGREVHESDLDVAVVGGGVSGVYSAWRLGEVGNQSRRLAPLLQQRRGSHLRIGLFEYGDRIGGRLFSVRLPGNPGPPAELGGMRFLTSHRRVHGLVSKKLAMPLRDLPVEDPGLRHLFYLRGRHFTGSEWSRSGFIPPYLLDRSERSRSPGNLLIEVALRHLGGRIDELRSIGYRSPSLASLQNIGFRNLLLQELSAEAYQLIRDACGYDTLVNNWSAAEAIPFLLADFDPNLKYYAFQDGFQSLPLRLADEFRDRGNGSSTIHLNHRLIRLDRNEDKTVRLVFDSGASPTNPRRASHPITYHAKHVILAMPRRSIELLHPDSFLFDNPQFGEDLQTVIPQPGFKIFAAYRRPWWLDQRGITAGRSVTDLPIRQCYYWGTGPAVNRDAPTAARNSSLMASYNDGGSVEFWAGLARDPVRYYPPPAACPPGVPIADPISSESASSALVAELQNQLREMHGLSTLSNPDAADINPPYAALFQDWTVDPYGGGWHFWRIGARANEVAVRMRHPSPPDPVYVCGEAWSHAQGWVEGALETADDVLENILLLPKPGWL
jgi:hypothetical protein